ncbi:MAG: restriction endonuclease subunit S [Planctomycetota bacterium]
MTIESLIDDGVVTAHKDGNYGSNYPRKHEFGDEGVQFLTAKLLEDSGDRIHFENAARLNFAKAKKLTFGYIEEDDVLLSHNATVGRVSVVPALTEPVLVGTSLTYFRLDQSRLLPRYLASFFRGREFQNQLSAVMSHSTRNQVPITAQRKLTVVLPPLSQQKAIAEILGTLDDKIELNRRMNETLEALARALFKSWFVDFDPVRAKMDGRQPTGMDADTAALFPDSFVRYDGEVRPFGWESELLENAMESVIDYRGKTPRKTESGVPLVTAKIVKGGRIREFGEFIDVDDYDSWMRRGIPKAGDIVMTTEAPLGEVAQLDDRKVALAQRVITLRGKSGKLANTYLRFLMQSPGFQADLLARSSGTTVVGIKQSELRKVRLVLPPISQQDAFVERVVSMTSRVDRNWRESETLAKVRDALLPKLLSGEIRVGDVEEQVTDTLAADASRLAEAEA